jgi:hypothetical protein
VAILYVERTPLRSQVMRRLVAVALLVPFLAACGSSQVNPRLEAFSQCMRTHGVPRFPDPRPHIGFAFGFGPQVRSGLNAFVAWGALNECKHLLPSNVHRTGWAAYAPLKSERFPLPLRSMSNSGTLGPWS